jgi:23S rRNA (adenine2503-C2)-methyltransferase
MVKDTQKRTVLKGMTVSELETWVSDTLGGKSYRGRQIYRWIYHKCSNQFEELTDMSKKVREELSQIAELDAIKIKSIHETTDGTKKLTFDIPRTGGVIESVYIPSEKRVTLCISSQVGCALGCTFCLTGKMGLHANLTAGEIVDQVVWSRRLYGDEPRISNIVFMGMGEPLHNYDHVVKAIRLLTDDSGLNFSHRKITVSTVGLVPAIQRVSQEDIEFGLAVSLNATTDEVRDKIMPINRKYNIETLIQTLHTFPLAKRRRITIEYVLLEGLNDTPEDARRLLKILKGLPSKVNLIPFNPHDGSPYRRPSERRVLDFQKILQNGHFNCSIRKTRGDDKMAACGQLGGGPDGIVPERKKSGHAIA